MDNTTGYANTFLGTYAGLQALGSHNVFIGNAAGYSAPGSSNVFIGNNAGYFETGSNKLYIANGSDTSDVLIYGDFFTGNVGMGSESGQDIACQRCDEVGAKTNSPSKSFSRRYVYRQL